jgi:hypothetical protein
MKNFVRLRQCNGIAIVVKITAGNAIPPAYLIAYA